MNCSNPRTISYQVPLHQSYYGKVPENQQIVVGCGKCMECLRKKQTNFSMRVYRSMQHYKNAWFVTLTYRDSSLPVACSIERAQVDSETGELLGWRKIEPQIEILSPVVYVQNKETGDPLKPIEQVRSRKAPRKGDYYIIENCEYLSYVRGKLLAQKACSKPRYFTKELDNPFLGISTYRYVYTFSVSRGDFQSWIKSSRIMYNRAFGKSLSEFKYMVVGEMGPKTCRPHMHCLFLSSDASFGEQLNWILQIWQRRFGFTQVKKVNFLNPDGSNGAIAVAKYVSKYITKGKFECESVKCRYAEKGRLCTSKYLGAEDFPDNFSGYYFGFDIYGPYDRNTLILDSGRKLQFAEVIHLCDVINRRAVFAFPDGKVFPMSQYYRDKLFCYEKITASGERKKCRYYVSFLASERLRDLQNESFSQRLQQALVGVALDCQAETISRFVESEQSIIQSRELYLEKTFESFYSNSIF